MLEERHYRNLSNSLVWEMMLEQSGFVPFAGVIPWPLNFQTIRLYPTRAQGLCPVCQSIIVNACTAEMPLVYAGCKCSEMLVSLKGGDI